MIQQLLQDQLFEVDPGNQVHETGGIDSFWFGVSEAATHSGSEFKWEEVIPLEPVLHGDSEGNADRGEEAEKPSDELVSTWMDQVTFSSRGRSWKSFHGGRLQSLCFSVLWKQSTVLDEKELVRGLFVTFGGDASFVLGWDVRETRADFMAVVRVPEIVRWRDWRRKFSFGHGGDASEPGLYVSLRVPSKASDEGVVAFVQEMRHECGTFSNVCWFREEEMMRKQSRSGRRKGRQV